MGEEEIFLISIVHGSNWLRTSTRLTCERRWGTHKRWPSRAWRQEAAPTTAPDPCPGRDTICRRVHEWRPTTRPPASSTPILTRPVPSWTWKRNQFNDKTTNSQRYSANPPSPERHLKKICSNKNHCYESLCYLWSEFWTHLSSLSKLIVILSLLKALRSKSKNYETSSEWRAPLSSKGERSLKQLPVHEITSFSSKKKDLFLSHELRFLSLVETLIFKLRFYERSGFYSRTNVQDVSFTGFRFYETWIRVVKNALQRKKNLIQEKDYSHENT